MLWEILLGLHALQERNEEIALDGWRRRTRPLIPQSLSPLFEIAPPRGYSADFITPTRGIVTLREGIEEILATTPDQLARDFTEFARHSRKPYIARSLEARAAVRRVAHDLERFFSLALAPHWRQITRDIEAERARLVQTLADHGVERLLGTLHPYARWKYPVLEVDDYVDQDVTLNGRGLVLLPSFFCRHHPITLRDPELPPLLVFPISRRTWLGKADTDEATRGEPLEGLLGRTRTTVLKTSTAGCSTTDIARAAGISPASASHHTKVLREAGLITTRRDGYAVCHEITDLGLTLLTSTDGTPIRQQRPVQSERSSRPAM
ncbi:helix-turn-helix domain-containing protein [Actinoallomurus vinaceus]|uniref:ArsR/SmtB family transcription factor n=1 Tax=Actinoallomurus vinaceus TaxID=1080074 RepID=UPI0031EF943C